MVEKRIYWAKGGCMFTKRADCFTPEMTQTSGSMSGKQNIQCSSSSSSSKPRGWILSSVICRPQALVFSTLLLARSALSILQGDQPVFLTRSECVIFKNQKKKKKKKCRWEARGARNFEEFHWVWRRTSIIFLQRKARFWVLLLARDVIVSQLVLSLKLQSLVYPRLHLKKDIRRDERRSRVRHRSVLWSRSTSSSRLL